MAEPKPTFYVFHGADEFTRAEILADFRRRLGPPDTVALNTTVFDGPTLTMAELRHACDSIPFLAEKRLVIANGLLRQLTPPKDGKLSTPQREYLAGLGDYLPRLPETTRLIFVEEAPLPPSHPIVQLAQQEPRGYVRRFEPPHPQALPRWIKKRVREQGGDIELQAAHQLATVVGTDLRLLHQEIVKLLTYTNAKRSITKADIETLVPYSQDAVIFDLVDALGRRDGRTAAQTLHRLLGQREHPHPLGVLAMIARQFRLLIQVKELKAKRIGPTDIAQTLSLPRFAARKLHNQTAHFSASQLQKVHRHLSDIDVAIKTGRIEAEVALDLLVAGLAVTDA